MSSKKAYLFGLFGTMAVGVSLVAAQSSKNSTSAHRSRDPLKAATQPITPKSAVMPHAKHHLILPPNQTSSARTELSRLEKQNNRNATAAINTGSAKSGGVTKTANKPARPGPKVEFKYQQPVGGMKASSPAANTRNSNPSRVTKNR